MKKNKQEEKANKTKEETNLHLRSTKDPVTPPTRPGETYLLKAATLHERRETLSVAGIGISAVCEEEIQELYVQGVDKVDLRAEEVFGVGVRAIFQEQFGGVVMIVLKSVRLRFCRFVFCFYMYTMYLHVGEKSKRKKTNR